MPQTKEELAIKRHIYYLKNKGRWEENNKTQHANHYWKAYLKKLKHWAVDKLGRKCSKCGLVSEFDCIYDFHHLEENSWSKGFQRSASNLRVKELLKWKRVDKIPEDIKLLCANCHRIEHS